MPPTSDSHPGRTAHEPAAEDQPHRRRADAAVRRRPCWRCSCAACASRCTRRWWPPTAWPRSCCNRTVLALCGAGHAGDAGLPAGHRAGALQRHHAVRRAGPRAVPLAAVAPTRPGATRRSGSSALIAPPPSVQSIEFPDGKLVVRANASRADARCLGRRAWRWPARRAALLLVVNALVFWLVGRTVRPFGQIVAGAEPAAGRALRRRAAAAGRHRGGGHRRRLQPHGRRAAGPHRDRAPRGARRAASCPTAASSTRWIDQHIEQERRTDRARAARRARPVGDRDAQHGAVDRAARAARSTRRPSRRRG